ncbi:glycoside hydrolase family 31 protein [Providencia rettgeri]|nr:glycoside hydrolase family 31 protein [Providencia rettgeri]
MKTLSQWRFISEENNIITLRCDGKHDLHIFILEEHLIRILVKKKSELTLDRTWTIAPQQKEVAWSGRDKMSTEGFTCPSYSFYEKEDMLEVETSQLKVIIHQPLWIEWLYKADNCWRPLTHDRKTGAFQVGEKKTGVAHYMNRTNDECYYGLGEKSGCLARQGRRFEMRNLDAMGYDATKTDPLYKHIPFYITKINKTESAAFGLFYDNLANCWFDLGNELDNYHVQYRSYRAEDGDLDLYFMFAESIKQVTQHFVRLTGGTCFSPKWSLGYSGSTMQYTDAPNSQQLLEGFVKKCQEYQIPCDSFQLSSGYTSIGDKRYVFNWNNSKVPDPKKMSDYFHQNGVKLAANIKPCLLHDHPKFAQAKEDGLFILDSEYDQPENSVFWDAEGSHLDFTNPKTVAWWQENVRTQLLDKGIDSTWNDNNEFEVWDSGARCFGFGKTIPINLIRPLQSLLMMRASFEAQREYAPQLRPYLISRSGCPGMSRYVQTWSGDNRTNWDSLKYNIKMGLGMSLSGLYNIGHDVGGFSGDRPDRELFIRWVQNGIMHPRFTIHSWNDDGSVNEPWMYPEITPIIRDVMQLRYRLIPYFYHALYQAHAHDEPMIKPTFLDHEHDIQTFVENDDFILGHDLLVASVVEPNSRKRAVYLPLNGTGWYDFYSHHWFSAGQTIELEAPLERLPLLVRAGAILPMSDRIHSISSQKETLRQLFIYPLKGVGISHCQIFDDDGESYGYQSGEYILLNIIMNCTAEFIELNITRSGDYVPTYPALTFQLPLNELRIMKVNGQIIQPGASILLADVEKDHVI